MGTANKSDTYFGGYHRVIIDPEDHGYCEFIVNKGVIYEFRYLVDDTDIVLIYAFQYAALISKVEIIKKFPKNKRLPRI